MSNWVPSVLRQVVIERAGRRCEYCRFPQAAGWLAFEMEHIVAKKHHGETIAENLALACPDCNRFKGTDLGSIDPETERLTPFFNPRSDEWPAHFGIEAGRIVPLTAEGRVTEIILRFNLPERIAERQRLMAVGQYP